MNVEPDKAPAAGPAPDVSSWVDEYGDYLYRYALLRLRDPASAEDAVQETFLAGIRSLSRYDGRVDLKYWLRGILRNKIVDHIRKAAREQPVEDVESLEVTETFFFSLTGMPTVRPSPLGFDPHRAYEKQEFWEIFQKCLGGLRGNLQQAFTLSALEGMQSRDVCKVLGAEYDSSISVCRALTAILRLPARGVREGALFARWRTE